ncbi:TetR family transcriptional regulator [Natronosporangium hydrolyticum]|uniref:TetR family transcriptional regulator n=1 Tax=Natronosporangium hydrolyticum TaxID=2811111 RepID=A0A895YF30_9ACTN|nr:TetR/AcrR family transcriptional regulator [Natronosporangium hydrolyticum]QSB13146.1 TetR family transcriptional regulator [Natronosporangium hydrolyticum]
MSGRREQILRAAGEIATERGMSALSVRAVADRAGIGASTLRHYFPTQRALLDAVAGLTLNAQLSDLRITDRSVPPAERLTECLAQFLPPTDHDRLGLEQWLALYAAALGPERTDQARQLLSAFTAHARHRVDAWFEVLAEEGALPAADLPRHATVLLALIDGLCLQLLTPEPATSLREVRELLADAVERQVFGGRDPEAR